jgi:hypothetical protein
MRTKEEARAYQQGYQTGRKRRSFDRQRELERAECELFKQRVFIAILPELVRSPWLDTVNGEKVAWSTMERFVRGAWDFADQAAIRANFSSLTLLATAEGRYAQTPPSSGTQS